jgi:hypothetical protein
LQASAKTSAWFAAGFAFPTGKGQQRMDSPGILDTASEPVEPPADRIEREIRAIASNLEDDRWATESYLSLEEGVDIFLDEDDDEALLETIEDMEEILEKAYHPYREAQVVDSEITAESAATHKLLMEGIESWISALEMLREEDSGDETDWSGALARAEHGNRLLVAVQVYNAQLQAQLAMLRDS